MDSAELAQPAHEYVKQVAPYDDSTVTADALARHLACQVQADLARISSHYYLQTPPGVDKDAAREWAFLLGRMSGYFGYVACLRALTEHAPDKADEIARWVNFAMNGEGSGEFIADWLVEYGIDGERIIAGTKPVERAVAS
ncbi:MAG TPA: hypothetical protein VK453_25170 [Micromonosporaceae bacterium]|nr:hypothetical protein [Micromonosporaceae bacterium]